MERPQINQRKGIITVIGVASAVAMLIWLSAGYFARGGGSSFSCPDQVTTVSLANTKGFVTTVQHSKGETPNSGIYEFVLKPGSTGLITLNYDSPYEDMTAEERIKSAYGKTPAEFYNSMPPSMWNIDKETGRVIVDRPASTEETGISVHVKDVTILNDGSVQVAYAIESTSSAENTTYALVMPHTCPGEILTISEMPYQGILPWSNGAVN